MTIIWILFIGFIIGLLARFLMPGKNPKGFIMTVLVGIGGAVVATYLGQFFGFYHAGEKAGFIGSVVGAILILAIYKSFTKN